jgi:hypothetical protein
MPLPVFEANDHNSVESVKHILNNKLNIELTKTIDKFDLFDLVDSKNKYFVEVKQRNNTHNKYTTTMIGYNKYEKAKQLIKNNYNVLFVFVFTDGTYYYKVSDEVISPQKGGRVDRGYNEIKNYIYINIDKLIKIE